MPGKSWFKFVHFSLMFVMLCCPGVLCLAQSDRGSVSGTVTDPTGSGIVGAKVTITNVAMGTQNSTVTTGAGDYTIPELAAGQYSVTVVATGFSTLIRNGITVSVGEVARVNLNLGVGQSTATVTVTADAALLQTDSPQNNVQGSTNDINEFCRIGAGDHRRRLE